MGIFGVISGSSISNIGVDVVGIDNIPDQQLIVGGVVPEVAGVTCTDAAPPAL